MRFEGDANADFGFKSVSEGVHKAYFGEGIEIKTNENTGKTSVWVPLVIDGGDDDGAKITYFLPYRDEKNFGEQRLAHVLAKAGLFAQFKEKFPGDVSLFDTNVFDMVKLKLVGRPIKILVVKSKDGKNSNVDNMYPVDAVVESKGKAAPKAAGPKSPVGEAKSPDW